MKTTTNYTLMLRGGSSVLFGKKELSELLTQIEPISLREFLLLGDDLPDDPPPEFEDGILVREIVNVSADESVVTDGVVDIKKVKPISFDPFGNAYFGVGEKVGNAFKDGAALK